MAAPPKMDPRAIDLTGTRHGMLRVVSYAGPSPNKRGPMWNVVCDCGAERVVRGGHLRSRRPTTSCGPCARRDGARRRWERPSEREKAKAMAVNIKVTPELRRKMSEAQKARYASSPEVRARLAYGRALGAAALTGRGWSPERRERHRRKIAERYEQQLVEATRADATRDEELRIRRARIMERARAMGRRQHQEE